MRGLRIELGWSVAFGILLLACSDRAERPALFVEAAGTGTAARRADELTPLLNASASSSLRALTSEEVSHEGLWGEVPAEVHWSEPLLEDLVADDIPFNGQAALAKVWWDYDVPLEPFVRALRSEDRQQRLFAADYLRHRYHEPTDDLIDVCFETIRYHEDDLGGELPFLLARSVSYLFWSFDKVQERLLTGLQSDDGQLRFYCAVILARKKSKLGVPAICTELISHLYDNEIAYDGSLAACALEALGEVVVPYASLELKVADEQAWTVLRALELKFIPRTAQEEVEWRQLLRNQGGDFMMRPHSSWTHMALPMGREMAEHSRWR